MFGWLYHSQKRTFYICLLFAVVHTIPIWVVQFPPLGDYPNHLLVAYVFANPGEAFAREFSPVPYWSVTLILYLLSRFASWITAGKIVLSLSVLLFIGGSYYFFRQVDQELSMWVWLLGTLAYNFFFMAGNVGYYLALGLSLVVLGYWYAKKDKGSQIPWPMLGLCTLLYFSHGIPFFFTFFFVMSCIGLRNILCHKRILSSLLWKAVLCFLPGTALFVAYLAQSDQSNALGPIAHLGEKIFVSIQALLIIGVEAMPAVTVLATLQNGVRIFLLTFVIFATFLDKLRTKKINRPEGVAAARWRKRPVIIALFFLSVGVWLLAPIGTLALVRIDHRIFPYVLLWGLCLLPLLSPKMHSFVQCVLVAGACLCLVLTTALFLRSDQVLREYYAQLLQLPEDKVVLSLTEHRPLPPRSVLDMLTPRVAMPYYFSCYYPLAKGGIHPEVFDTGPIKPKRYFPTVTRNWAFGEAKRFDFSCRKTILERMDEMSLYYDIVLLWGAPCVEAGKLLERYGYRWFSAHREMAIWVRSDALNQK